MNRPLETTFWMRFKQFMKGVFLYNTIYWRRASDDLDIRRMSREERASLRPKRDLDIIRPRDNPRPTGLQGLSLSGEVSEPVRAVPTVAEPVRQAEKLPPAATGEEESVEIRRRKKRRNSRHSKVMPKQYYDPTYEESSGFLGRWFKK